MRKTALWWVVTAVIAASFLFSTSDIISIDKQVEEPTYKPGEIIVKFKEGAAETLEKQLSKGVSARALKMSAPLDELSYRYKVKEIKPLIKGFKAERQRIRELLQKDKASLTKTEVHLLRRLKRAPRRARVPKLDRIYKIELEEGQSAEEAVTEYKRNPDVEYAELNYIVSIDFTPNDSRYPIQWPLNNTGQMYPESGNYNHPPGTVDCDIDAPEAWDISTGSSDIVVAVVDTGVDYTHRDLQGNIWINQAELNGSSGIDDDGNGYIDDIYGYDFINNDSNPKDDHGHGTHCSGVITAKGNNGLDIAGVCWNCKIMGLKFLGSNGSGPISAAISAFYYATANGADVMSNSWGGGGYSSAMEEAINYAHSQGVIMVASAGNCGSDSPQYPACYEHIISVAATNSNDEKASFSNYGVWVDIAAPGVDVLSLRASGTSMGTVYDSFTTIASGTSMSCPHVSGACALVLSADPTLTSDEVRDILTTTADPIAPEICQSGRLNLFNALLGVVTSQGSIRFDNDFYSCSGIAGIYLRDSDLAGNGSQGVTVTTSSGDCETVNLTETSANIGVFTGTIAIAAGEPTIGDGILQANHNQIITATYYDADNGSGEPATVNDTAVVDCQGPVIFNVQIDVPGPAPTVAFETNEPAAVRVLCGERCEDPNLIIRGDATLATNHSIKLSGVFPETDYFFVVEATDIVGNKTVDSNSGQCYNFTTDSAGDISVPSDYTTIQEAINRCWDGGRVIVADGVYAGEGNRDIDFLGKAITVESENGPENCIIDCETGENHTGFYFHSNEGLDSILDGFTITNGNGHIYCDAYGCWACGGGIFCFGAGPTIRNCIITNNTADLGGGISCKGGSAEITNCIIKSNSSQDGGGIYTFSDAKINNCFISNNYAYVSGGGGIYGSKLRVTNCVITGNSTQHWSHGGGIGAHYTAGDNIITNCIVVNNSAGDIDGYGGGIHPYCSNTTIINCIVRGNSATYGNQIAIWSWESSRRATVWVSYNDIQGGLSSVYYNEYSTLHWDASNIDADPLFVTGPYGNYYLSQIAAGQAVDSPCVDAGSNTAANLEMFLKTTRTDGFCDAGIVDIGYHYPVAVLLADTDGDLYVDFFDFAILAADWLKCSDPYNVNCTETGLLDGDIIKDYYVNLYDLAVFVDYWLECLVEAASGTEPADGAIDVERKVILSWAAKDGVLEHDVYFGTDAIAVAEANHQSEEFMDTVSEATFDPCKLDASTTYFWRIDEIGLKCETKGKVWSFTTWKSDHVPNLVGWWKFDESSGTTAYDTSGRNDGTLVNGPVQTVGKIYGALDFDGTDDYVSVPDANSLDFSTEDLSVSLWIKPADLGDGGIVGKYDTERIYNYAVWYEGGILYFEVGNSGPPQFETVVSSTDINNASQWYHITGTYDHKHIRLYIDGQEVDNKSENRNLCGGSRPLCIGTVRFDGKTMSSLNETDDYFHGLIDDVRIYDRVLSVGEIEQIYHLMGFKASHPNPDDGTTGVDSNTILSWSPGVNAVSHDVYLGIDFYDVNNATKDCDEYMGNYDVNSFGPCSLDVNITYYWRIDEVNGPDIYKGDVWSFTTGDGRLELNLISRWEFEEGSGTTAHDSAGDNDGTLIGDPCWVTGKIGSYALDFDGSGDYISIGNTVMHNIARGTFTAWVNPTDLRGECNGYYFKWVIGANSSAGGELGFRVNSDRSVWASVQSTTPGNLSCPRYSIIVGSWQHVAITWDGSYWKLYINGVQKDIKVHWQGTSNASNTALIGNGWDGCSWNGKIDDVCFYNRALTAEEIEQLYLEGL